MPGQHFLELGGLAKTFPDGTEAVKGIDLSVAEGEFIVLLGPSGCGKTTTLRMIAGLEVPTAGRVLVAGEDVTGLRPSARDVGFVFQFYALYPHMTVRDNVAFPLDCVRTPRESREKTVDSVARRLGIERLMQLYPRQLSGGDQQRVALARAMVRHPRLYLMDEPLGTLDADLRQEMREFIRAQQLEMGVTTIYVTHDQEEAMTLADRIVVMEAGAIRQVGPPAQVHDDPADLFVANFIGSPGMNFVPGEVEVRDDATMFVPTGCGSSIPVERTLAPGTATLGVRPEHVRADPEGALAGTVVADEYLGSSRCVHLDAPFGRLIMRAPPGARTAAGETIRLGFDAAHTRFFDPATGRRL